VLIYNIKTQGEFDLGYNPLMFVRSYRPFIKTLHKNWCPLNNFWKNASIRFIFGMLIYNIKTQVEFDLGYNTLIFTELWAFYKNIAHFAGASVSYGHISSC